ncbi:hypothetical protein Hanom_Chr08g00686281 [Helianthus anomalus]
MMHNLTVGTNQMHTVCIMMHNLTKLSISCIQKCWFRSQNTHHYLFVNRQKNENEFITPLLLETYTARVKVYHRKTTAILFVINT